MRPDARGHTFIAPLLRRSQAPHRIHNRRNGRVLAYAVTPAFDSKSRRAGLLGCDSLADGHAMVIAPSNAVHTWFMRFAIDLAFVTKDGRVVKICTSVRPWRVAAALRADAVIELPAGTLARCDTVPGDTLVIAVARNFTSRASPDV
jgi:uncharacterized membrane protein (UPF0127 family)